MNERFEFNNIPTRWEDITLELFQQIKSLYDANDGKPSQTALLALLTNKEEQEIKELPMSVSETLIDSMSFMNTPVTTEKSNKIEVGGEAYMINTQEELKFGEFVDINTVMESDVNNLAAILAIICRKEGEVYDDDFIAKELDKRIAMFKQQPMTKIQPLINFFIASSVVSVQAIQQYSEELKKVVNNILNSLEISMKNGAGKRLSTKWQMRKLRKLKKSLKSI